MKRIKKLIKDKKKLMLFTTIKMINAFIGLFINMFIVRKITVEDFGVYSIILTVIGFLTTFGFSWSSSAITYFGAKEKARTGNLSKTFWSRNYIVFGSLSLVLLIFLIFGKQIENYIGLPINYLLIIWLLIKIGIDSLSTYFLAIKKQLTSSLILLVGKIFFLLAAIFLDYSLTELIIINILCDLTGLFYILKIDKVDIGKPTFDKENFKEVLNFGLWQLFGFSGLYLINFGDNFVIKYFLTMEDVGIYNAAYRLFNAIASLSFIFSSYYAPVVMEAIEKKNKKTLKNLFYKERYFLIVLLLIPHILVIVFAKQIITIIYGIAYVEAISILQILMIGSFIRFATVFNVLVYNGLKKYKEGQILNIFRAILNIILDIIFIKHYGIMGAAYGTLGALIVTAVWGIIFCEREIKKFIF